MKRLHISSLIVIGAISTLISSGAPASPAPDSIPSAPSKDFECAKTKSCPMQKWMKDNMQPFLSDPDKVEFDKLSKALDYVSKHSPGAGYDDWAKKANTAKAAAEKKQKGDINAIYCKDCHDSYRKKYRDDQRDKPF